MEDIVEQHVFFFETLRYFTRKKTRRLRYVVGNHDFGVTLDPRLLEMIRDKFGLVLTPENHYREASLGIWAEHGHRYDIVNNTFNSDGTPIPYSLGDKIVVEIVDKFYEKVREKQDELGIDPAIINDLDNVRPQTAIDNWLDSIDEEGRLKQIYYDTITAFVVSHPGEVGNLVLEIIAGKYQPDLVKAAEQLAKEGVGKYIIFGHTHDALTKDLKKGRRHLNTEVEISLLVAALVKATQPEFIVEVGSHYGQTAERMARVILENGHGEIVSLEIDHDLAGSARHLCQGLPVEIICIDSTTYIPPKPINFLFVDGSNDRWKDVEHFLPYMAPRSLLLVHGTGAPPVDAQVEQILSMCGGDHVQLDSPRGFLI